MENVSFFIINILLPIAGIVALVFLSVVFYNVIITIKGINPLIKDVTYKLDVLNIPIDMIVKLSNSWNKVAKKVVKQGVNYQGRKRKSSQNIEED